MTHAPLALLFVATTSGTVIVVSTCVVLERIRETIRLNSDPLTPPVGNDLVIPCSMSRCCSLGAAAQASEILSETEVLRSRSIDCTQADYISLTMGECSCHTKTCSSLPESQVLRSRSIDCTYANCISLTMGGCSCHKKTCSSRAFPSELLWGMVRLECTFRNTLMQK